jgi:hypothetical protein
MRLATALSIMVGMILIPAVSRGEILNTDGVEVSLELPEDPCSLSRDNPADRHAYEMQERFNAGTNFVLLMANLCSEAERVRKGFAPTRWAIWLISAS